MRKWLWISPSSYDLLNIYKIFFPPDFVINITGELLPVKQIDLHPQPKTEQPSLLKS